MDNRGRAAAATATAAALPWASGPEHRVGRASEDRSSVLGAPKVAPTLLGLLGQLGPHGLVAEAVQQLQGLHLVGCRCSVQWRPPRSVVETAPLRVSGKWGIYCVIAPFVDAVDMDG